jgi:hypothetical protein
MIQAKLVARTQLAAANLDGTIGPGQGMVLLSFEAPPPPPHTPPLSISTEFGFLDEPFSTHPLYKAQFS